MNLEDVIERGTRAAQPLATAVAKGTLYYVTDETLLERSNGSSWQSYSTAVSAGITALTGNVTASGTGSVVATIANDVVTYAKIQNISTTSRILGRKTAGSGDVEEATLSEILDFIGSAAQGDILYRGAATWARLAAGTGGQILETQGVGANPTWANPSTVGIWLVAVKSADEAANSNRGGGPNFPWPDDDLQFAMDANTTYRIRARLFFEILNSSSGNRLVHRLAPVAPIVSSPALVNGQVVTYNGTGTMAPRQVSVYDTSNFNMGTLSNSAGLLESVGYFDMIIQNGANAGVFAFNWVSGSSAASSCTLRKGSYLEYQSV